jgi:hypothetical protein
MSNPYHGNFGRKALQHASRICVETSLIAREVLAAAPWASSRIEIVGYPSINGARMNDKHLLLDVAEQGVLFAPHWTSFTSDQSFRESKMTELATGLNSINSLWPGVPIMLRPHPRLLEALTGFLPDGLEALGWSWMKYSSSANPLDDFSLSKILITNSASFVGEFTFTEKPLVFWQEGSEVLPFLNEFGRECLNVNYICSSKEALVQIVSELLAGRDTKLEDRKRFIEGVRKEFKDKTFENLVASIITEIL